MVTVPRYLQPEPTDSPELVREIEITNRFLADPDSATSRLFDWVGPVDDIKTAREYMALVRTSGRERRQAGDPRLEV